MDGGISQLPMGRQLAGVDVDQAIVKAPADHSCIADDGQKAGLEDLSLRRVQLAGQLGCAAVDRKQAAVERRVDVAIGSGADHALLHVEEHEVDQRQGIVAGLSEIVQRLARRAELQAGVAPVGVEHLADDLAIGRGYLLRRGRHEAGGQKDLVVRVQRIQFAQQGHKLLLAELLEVGFEVGPGRCGHRRIKLCLLDLVQQLETLFLA